MFDIKFIRENLEKVKEACKNKQVKVDVDRLLKIDKEKRGAQTELENILAQKNKASKEIAAARDKNVKKKIISEMQQLDKKGDKFKKVLKKLNEQFETLIYQIPNMPQDDVPVGKDEKDNKVIRKWGGLPEFNFKPKSYL